MRTFLLLSAFFFLSTAACGDEPDPALGDLGRLRFTYDDDFGCFTGCSVQQPIARGAHAVVDVRGDDPYARYHARPMGPQIVVEREDLSCTCHEGNSGSFVRPDEPCPGETRCARLFDLRAVSEGRVVLEVLGPSNDVIDKVSFTVARAERIEPVVTAVALEGGIVRTLGRESDGSFRIDAPIQLVFSAAAVDVNGHALRTTTDDFRIESDHLALTDRTNGERTFDFEKPADATLTSSGLGLVTSFAVHVRAPER